MDSRNFRPGCLPWIEAASFFPPFPHYEPPFYYAPPQQFAPGLPHYPWPQHFGHNRDQLFTRTPFQHFEPSPQWATLGVRRNHYESPPENWSFRPQHLASAPTRRSAHPKVQKNHRPCWQIPIPPSKRQKPDELGVPDDHPEDERNNCKTTSLRNQKPANFHRKRDHDDDHSDKKPDDAEDDDDDSDFGEEHSNGSLRTEREETAYKKLLPKVEQLVSELGGVNENWVHDREEKMCMVCKTPIRLKGWKALLQHAESFQKKKWMQHRALFRALSELLKKEGLTLAGEVNSVLKENETALEEVIVWPPVVIIDNMGEEEYLEKCLMKLKPSDIQRTCQFSKSGPPEMRRKLVVFPASEVGHLDSKMLVYSLAKLLPAIPGCARLPLPPRHIQDHHRGRRPRSKNNRQVEIAQDCPRLGQLNAPSCDQEQGHQWTTARQHQQQPLRVFLAQATDMQQMDPQRKLVQWSTKNKWEILKSVLKKSKEEHELEKAKVEAKRVEVDHIAKSHQPFKSRKAVLSQQLKDAEMELNLQKCREEQMAKQHAEQLHEMDNKFKEESRRLEIERVDREARIRQLLRENEEQLEKEREERSKEVDSLLKHLENVNQELQDHAARKALENEREIARRGGEIYKEIKLREAKFNEGHSLEKNLLHQQESEKMKFLDEYNKIGQDLLSEWVAKQAALQDKAEKAKQEKELLMPIAESKNEAATGAQQAAAECSICFEEFDDNKKRALMQPCGHAKTCLPCAAEIFSRSKLCPICRVKISSKPKGIPYKLIM